MVKVFRFHFVDGCHRDDQVIAENEGETVAPAEMIFLTMMTLNCVMRFSWSNLLNQSPEDELIVDGQEPTG